MHRDHHARRSVPALFSVKGCFWRKAVIGQGSNVIRGALAADDALRRQESETKFRVREAPDWRHHAADLEAEMLKRGMMFEVIDWSEDQA
jgi:hypothetical protein